MLTRLLFVIFALVLASPASAGGTFGHGYTTLTLEAQPLGIVAGPDGAMWFTEGNRIGRITFDGELFGMSQFFPIVPAASNPVFITPGPDGNLWFTQTTPAAIGKLTPAGVADSFPVPAPDAGVAGSIVTGPDGNLWFPAYSQSRGGAGGLLGRITTGGTISLFPLESEPSSVTNGPDGALWVTAFGRVGRVTTSGADDFFDVQSSFSSGITTGPDAALWFTTDCGDPSGAAFGLPPCDYGIGRLTVDGELTKFPQVDPYSAPLRITRGPEDNLWFTRENGISRINLAGRVDDIINFEDDDPLDIAVGPDGHMWFTLPGSSRIGRVNTLVFNDINLPNSEPIGMAPGLDGTVWFTDCAGNRVGRLGRGSLVQHEVGADRCPSAIAAAPDGGAWFVNFNPGTIGRVSAEGEVDELSLPPPDDLPNDIVFGPDGNFWVTLDLGSIARITPEGEIDIFPTATEEAGPNAITVGPDGNLWFTERLVNRIGRMSPDGEAVDFPIPFNDEPWDITTAPDGAMYFTQTINSRVGRITTDGEITPLDVRFPEFDGHEIAPGPDGALWFTMVVADPGLNGAEGQCTRAAGGGALLACTAGKLGRIAADGRVTTFDLPNGERFPAGLAGTEDGILFVAMSDSAQIASIELVAAEPTPTFTDTPEETPTPTRTRTATRTQTAAATATATRTGTVGATSTVTRTATRTPTTAPGEATATPTVTRTMTRTATRTSTTAPGEATATPTEDLPNATATPTEPGNEPTATETPTDNTPLPTETQTFLTCAGDCDSDNAVSISELVTSVNIALGQRAVEDCFSADVDGDSVVRVNELIAAVGRALRGC